MDVSGIFWVAPVPAIERSIYAIYNHLRFPCFEVFFFTEESLCLCQFFCFFPTRKPGEEMKDQMGIILLNSRLVGQHRKTKSTQRLRNYVAKERGGTHLDGLEDVGSGLRNH